MDRLPFQQSAATDLFPHCRLAHELPVFRRIIYQGLDCILRYRHSAQRFRLEAISQWRVLPDCGPQNKRQRVGLEVALIDDRELPNVVGRFQAVDLYSGFSVQSTQEGVIRLDVFADVAEQALRGRFALLFAVHGVEVHGWMTKRPYARARSPEAASPSLSPLHTQPLCGSSARRGRLRDRCCSMPPEPDWCQTVRGMRCREYRPRPWSTVRASFPTSQASAKDEPASRKRPDSSAVVSVLGTSQPQDRDIGLRWWSALVPRQGESISRAATDWR